MVAAGDDSRITGALQKENNLSDLSDTSEALKALGLNSDGAAYRAIVDAIFMSELLSLASKVQRSGSPGRHGLT